MNVFLSYLVGLLTGAVLAYGILAAQRKPPTRSLAIREAEQIVDQFLR